MECDALVIYSSRETKKGKTLHHKSVLMRQVSESPIWSDMQLVERFQKYEQGGWIIDRVEKCGGVVEARVEACDEPYFGGTSSTLHVGYTCRKCKCNFYHPDLPDSYNISEWLTERVDKLTRRPGGNHKRKSAAEVLVERKYPKAQGTVAVPATSKGNSAGVRASHGWVA